MSKSERNVIKLPEGRLSFAYLATPKAKPRRDDGSQPDPTYEAVVLLDPSNSAHAAAIKALKEEAQRIAASDPKLAGVPVKKLVLAFGSGDKKAIDEDGASDPTYEAYKGMFYVNTASRQKPLIGDRSGKVIEKEHPQFPYSGCYANVRVTLYPWHHVQTNRRGISVDLRSVQFVKDGPAFGRGPVDPDEEFEPLGDAAEGAASTSVDGWDD